jgi:PAS domain S-box-containing protein
MDTKPTYEQLEQRVEEQTAELATANETLKKLIEERKRTEERLHAYEQIVSTITDIIFFLDRNYRYQVVNDAYLKAFPDKRREEIVGHTPADLIGEENFKNKIKPNLDQCFKSKIVNYQDQFEFPGEGKRYMDVRYYPVFAEDGTVSGIVHVSRDITEWKKIERDLHDSQHMLKAVMDSIPAAVFWKDRDLLYLGGNRTFLAAVGLNSSEEVVGKNDYELPWDKEQTDSFREDDRKVIESGIPEYDIIEPYLKANGTHAWAKTNKVPLRDAEGNIIGVLGTYEDITKRKQAEEKLRQSERDLRIRNQIAQIFLTIPDEEMYEGVLQVVLEALESKYGIFGYIDEHGTLVIPSMTKDIWERCQVPDKTILYPRETWGGIWGQSLIEKRSLYANRGLRVPEGHIPITRVLVVPIKHRGEVVGLLEVANKATDYDDKDRELLETISEHIAPILHARLQRDRQGSKRKLAEEDLWQRTHDLGKRVNELNCLYGISRLRENRGLSLGAILKRTVALIPSAWQYSEITCARIILEGQEFTTDNFRETDWRQASDIVVNGERSGVLEVFYLEERPEADEGPFLKEERKLIDAIAERLGKITERKRAEEMLQEAYYELEQRVEERTAELTKANEQLSREMENRKGIEENLRRDRSSLAEAQRIAHVGNWNLDIITNELKWSDEIYRIFGLAPQEFGATYEAFLNSVHPDDRELVMKAVDEALSGDKPYSIDHRVVLPDGTERIVHEEAAITLDGHGEPIGMIGTVHDITDRKLAQEALEKSEANLRRLSSQLIEIQETERKRIAMELHDSTGQFLAAIKFALEDAVAKMPESMAEESVESLKALVPLIQQASDEVRRIHTDLRPGLLDDLGIVATVSWFCREFEKLHSGLRIERRIDIEEREIPDPLKIIIFRVLQEALNNVSKHAKAYLVRLSMKSTPNTIDLVIEDNGEGFDIQQARDVKLPNRGFGLTNMKERTELSGGGFTIRSAKGAGTTVRASWPKKQ